jgi:hypothetical protein
MDGMDRMDGMDPEGEALHLRRKAGGGRSLVLRARATSHGHRSLRSASGHMDGMDRMDGMDPEGEALHLRRKA